MPARNAQDEIKELKEQIKGLEADLAAERKKKDEKKKRRGFTDAVEDLTDEFNKINRGLFFAGLESLRLMGKATVDFVEGAYAENNPKNKGRSNINDLVTNLPRDLSESTLDVLDDAVDYPRKIVDVFNDKSKEG